MNIEEHIFFFILFGLLGITSEVIFISLSKKPKDRTLKGHSSLWMFFIYGMIYFIVLFGTTYLSMYNFFIRGLVYMILIYILEFASGFVLKKFRAVPWDYSKTKKHHFKGLICPKFAILWFAEGLAAELIYLYIKSHIVF